MLDQEGEGKEGYTKEEGWMSSFCQIILYSKRYPIIFKMFRYFNLIYVYHMLAFYKVFTYSFFII